ncbi:MAG: hypothetical protein ACXVAY_23235 [Mucilaginibacter sp.]
MYKAIHISPMIPSYKVAETANFFRDWFSFSTRMDGDYVILNKDDTTIHILNAGTDIGEMEFYLEVDDIDGLWETIKDKLEDIKVRPPFNREYGMREFHVIIPHTKTLLFVGQWVRQA